MHEILLSGSVGSAKSILMAHIGIKHCLKYAGAHMGIGRKSMPQLRDTLIDMYIQHLGNDVPYTFNKSRGIIEFPNGSKVTPISWSDKNYKKVRSYTFSAFQMEEVTENETEDAYKEIIQRVGRSFKKFLYISFW